MACIVLLCNLPNRLRQDQGPESVRAAINGSATLLEELKRGGADLNAQDASRYNWTPLIAAIYHGRTNVVSYLLQQNVDVSRRDRNGKTALMWAITCDDTNAGAAILRALNGPNSQNEDWATVSNMLRLSPISNQWTRIFEENISTNRHASTN